MGPPVDYGLAILILRILEAWELGNKGLYRKYWAYKKSSKFQNLILVPGVRKNDFYNFQEIFTRKIGNTGFSSETTIPGISSETTETRESRVRRREIIKNHKKNHQKSSNLTRDTEVKPRSNRGQTEVPNRAETEPNPNRSRTELESKPKGPHGNPGSPWRSPDRIESKGTKTERNPNQTETKMQTESKQNRVSVVSLEIPGIVVSLEIPVFPIFLVKIDFFIVKSIPGSPEKPYAPGGTKKTRLFSGQKTYIPI